MAIIKRTDFADKGIAADYVAEMNKAIAATKKLQAQIRGINKTGGGSEAKERVKLMNQVTTATNKVTVSQSKLAEQLEKTKMQQRDQNQLNKANAVLNNKLAGTEEKLLASNTKLRLERKKLIETDKNYNKQLKKINSQIDKNTAKMKKNADAMKKQKMGIGGYVNSLKAFGKQMLAMAGGMTAFFAVINVIKDAFTIFVQFSKEASRLAAILGKTKKEIKALTEQAKQLGATTMFTARQIIALQTELAKLGFDQEAIENSTEGILSLAAATGYDLASSAELAGATLRIFNLDAKEMARVSDVLALSTSKSALDMSKLATALPIVGKTADIAGLSLEQTTAVLGTLVNRGIDASMAGTSLRNVFLQLSKKGLTYNEAMERIRGSLDKNKTAMDIFGKRAATAGIILSQTARSTEQLTKDLNKAKGAADAMAKTMLNNLAGDITIANSAWQGFILSLEDGEGVISSMLRGIVQDFTEFLNALTMFNTGDFTTQLKLIHNGFVNMAINAIPALEALLKLLGKVTGKDLIGKLKFDIDEVVKKKKKEVNIFVQGNKLLQQQLGYTKDFLKMHPEVIAITNAEQAALDKRNKELAKANKLKKEEADIYRQRARDLVGVNDIGSGKSADEVILDNEKQLKADLLEIDEEHYNKKAELREEELQRIQDWEDARVEILLAAEKAATQLLSDVFSAFQDERLAEYNTQAEAEKQILKDKLDKGVINQEEYSRQIADIEKNQRIESAKADKKKALFDIAISVAVGVVKALAALNPILAVTIAAIGAIQAAAVIAKPIPAFAKGTEYVKGEGTGTSDSIHAMLSKGERVIPADINRALDGIPNAELPDLLTQRDTNLMLSGELIRGNQYTKQLVALMSNMGYTVTRDGKTTHFKADGSPADTFKQ